ncbi:hypothetical protein RHSIM_Rhsim10G0046000 [Rhododendron simsii]|uniref:Cytochrome P450 n=1 Tax=Rhododendron simsii TaxID=118357 RepID=A0A834L964_RHOSS|nr:hypothetical protein RHSIM_Rhsim10G0046000 [Rhododendron simsii]
MDGVPQRQDRSELALKPSKFGACKSILLVTETLNQAMEGKEESVQERRRKAAGGSGRRGGRRKKSQYLPNTHFYKSVSQIWAKIRTLLLAIGGGSRMCLGKEFARLEILLFVHHLVKRFRWEKLIPDEKTVYTPIANPEKGLPIRLFAHEA